MAGTNKVMRVLSVFVAVVIVAVGFMQPVAYASIESIIAGDIISLFILVLLQAAGIVLSDMTPQQSEGIAAYAESKMPKLLWQQLMDALQWSATLTAVKAYPMMEKGLNYVSTLPVEVWNNFKSWANETFGINAETAAAGQISYANVNLTGLTVTIESSSGSAVYPIYEFKDYTNSDKYAVDASTVLPFKFNNEEYTLKKTYSAGNYTTYEHYTYSILKDGKSLTSIQSQADYPLKIHFMKRVQKLVLKIYGVVPTISGFTGTYSDSREVTLVDGFFPVNYVAPSVAVSPDAYAHTMPDEAESVQIALPRSIGDVQNYPWLAWNDYLSNYDGIPRAEAPTADWDYRKSLDKMRKDMEDICVDLGHFGTGVYDGLLNQAAGMQTAIDLVNELVAAQGADVVGGTQALNDAMVEAGLVIQGLQSLLDAQTQAAAEEVAKLEAEVAKAKEAVQDLTKDKSGDVVTPDIPDEKEGEIDWKILTTIAVFDKFPFCLPKDLYNFVSILAAPPKEPVFEVDIFNGKFNGAGVIRLDFSSFEEFERIRLLIRNGFLILLIIGLMGATKKYIWTGGG